MSLHRIGRQHLELRVSGEAAAAAAYAELRAAFGDRVAPLLDAVLSAACPDGETLRVERVELDLGVVPACGLTEALLARLRDPLEAALQSRYRPAEGGAAARVRRMRNEDVELERVVAFVRSGAVSWRDAGLGRMDLEATVLRCSARAPHALRTQLQRVPWPAAQRLRWLLTPAARRRLLADLTGLPPSTVDEWYERAAALARAAAEATSSPPLLSQGLEGRLFESTLAAVLQSDGARAAIEALATALWDVLRGASGAAAARVLAAAAKAARAAQPPHSVWRRTVEAASRLTSGEVGPRRDAAAAPALTGTPAADARTTEPRVALAGDLPRSEGDACDASVASLDTARPVTAAGPRATAEHARASTPSAGRPDRIASPSAPTPRPAPREAQRGGEAVSSDDLWVGQAGLVLLWPFLTRFFQALGLLVEKRFADADARERAVLLLAHLADGGRAWGEHELALHKLLCGHPLARPLATEIALRDDERGPVEACLASVLEHWGALQSTSAAGLRQAFVCRGGRLRVRDSGATLTVPRTGVDVLLDRLPWGFGLVLLPWMERPLYVEW